MVQKYNKPKRKKHRITCATTFSMTRGRRCDCGAREWNLCYDSWEKWSKRKVV